jgi:hypothetical protein
VGGAEWRNDWTIWFQASPIEFKNIWNDNLPGAIAAGGGGRMSYEISAIFNQMPFSDKAELSLLDTISTRPPARAPDTPSSTR